MTTKASFIVLDKSDYVVINDQKIYFDDAYCEMPISSFSLLLTQMLVEHFPDQGNFQATTDNVNRLKIWSLQPFTISDMSYNMKMVSGFYNDAFPLTLEEEVGPAPASVVTYYVKASSVGYSLLTPIFYLISNLGSKCYDNVDKSYFNHKVLMRVSNSFMANYPIISSNAEFTSLVPVNSLSDIEFHLVDANMHPIKLLSPMYLSVYVETIDDPDVQSIINEMTKQQQQQQQE